MALGTVGTLELPECDIMGSLTGTHSVLSPPDVAITNPIKCDNDVKLKWLKNMSNVHN